MADDQDLMDKVLEAVPQRHPFRFIDKIMELDDKHIVGAYRYREDEYFYRGHFPGNPITPGVILIETMAQTGVVAFGIYLTMLQMNIAAEQTKGMTTLFTLAEDVEFMKIVYPGDRMIVHSEKIYFRKGSLKAKVRMEREDGQAICRGVLSGMGARTDSL
jgi:3-hydroxyacyl-[acyl-carrier-protein] dehydratase